MPQGQKGEVVLVTGYPGFRARKLVEQLLAKDAGAELRALVHFTRLEQARAHWAGLTAADQERFRLLEADPTAIDFGLSGSQYRELSQIVHAIYHLYQATDYGIGRAIVETVNIGGTREIIEFGRVCRKLRQIVHFSSVLVSGNYSGAFMEGDLRKGQSFRSPTEETLARSELMLSKEQGRLPITVLRPGIIVGDSRTGEMEPLHALYSLVLFVIGSPGEVVFPTPLRQNVILHLVPVDFVMSVARQVATDPDSTGRVLHILDPQSVSVRRFVELVAEHCGKEFSPIFSAGALARALLKKPGLELFRRSPRALFDLLKTEVVYGTEEAQQVLSKTGLVCPSIEAYLGQLVRFTEARMREPEMLFQPRASEAAEFVA